MSDKVKNSESKCDEAKKEVSVAAEVEAKVKRRTHKERENVRFWNIEIFSLTSGQKIEKIVSDLTNNPGDPNTAQKILYYLIRSDDVELFEKVLTRWRCCNSDDQQFERKLNDQLSEAFEELQLKNVPISDKMTCAVVELLIGFQYGCQMDKQSGQKTDLKRRIDMVCQQIVTLNNSYSCECDKREVDEEFIFLARFVARNIRILKRMLRSTYDQLPWEEMEFCLVAFLASETKQQDINFYYKVVLDKNRILKHLVTFAEQLSNLRLNEIGDKKNVGDRTGVVEIIIKSNPQFQGLYGDFEAIRDVYSLSRAERYIELTEEVDLEENFELGKLVVERGLQVVGECLKNTLESPNLSDDIQNHLLHSAPRNLREIITLLRDSLSHWKSIERKLQIEYANDLRLHKSLQSDIVKIGNEIRSILNKKKMDAVKLLARKIVNCSDLEEIRMLRGRFKNANLDAIDFRFKCSSDFKQISLLVDELRREICGQNPDFTKLLDEIENNVKHHEGIISTVPKRDFQEQLLRVKYSLNHFKNVDIIKSINRSVLETLTEENSEKNLEVIQKLLKQINNTPELSRFSPNTYHILYKMQYIVKYDERNVNTITEFKEVLEKINKAKMVDAIIERIAKCISSKADGDVFRKRVQKLKDDYEHKQQLISLFEHAIKHNEPAFKEKYDFLVQINDFSKAQRNRLEKLARSCRWSDCKQFVDNMRDSYKTFCDSYVAVQRETKKQEVKKVVLNFVQPILKNQEGCIEMLLKEEENDVERYFCDCLKLLDTIVPSNNQFKCIIVFEKLKRDRQLQAAVEMILLDLMEMLEYFSALPDNGPFLDRPSPVLIGKQLRNYLAHGDALVDVLPLDSDISLARNAILLTSLGNKSFRNITEERVGQNMVEDISRVETRFEKTFTAITNQKKMFVASRNGETELVRRLADSGIDLKARNAGGLTALHLAAQRDKIELVKLLLDRNPGVNISKDLVDSTLLVAAANGSINSVKYILQMAEIYSKDVDTQNVLFAAAENGHYEVMQFLKSKGLLAIIDEDELSKLLNVAVLSGSLEVVRLLRNVAQEKVKLGGTHCNKLLFYAALNGDVSIVNMLLEKTPANYNVAEPLIIAAIAGHDSVLDALLSKEVCHVESANNKEVLMLLHFAADNGHQRIIDSLISAGATVDVQDGSGTAALHLAAANGNGGAVKALLHHKAIVDIRNLNGRTPLHLAGHNGCVEVAQLLLSNLASCNARDKFRLTPFCLAVANGHSAAALMLLEKLSDVNDRDSDHRTPLHKASMRGDVDVVSALLDRRAEINVKNVDQATPLHGAAHSGHPDVVQLLLSRGKADLDVEDVDNCTPLHLAVLNGHTRVCRVLLNNHAAVNVGMRCGSTPLHLAAMYGTQELVSLLLTEGAGVDAKNNLGVTPLHLAVQNDRRLAVDTLLKIGKANVNATDNDNNTALNMAAKRGFTDIVLTLLSSNEADIDLANDENMTPLQCASFDGHKYAVMALLRRGASVNTADRNNQTSLHLAAGSNHADVCQILLDNKADVDAEDVVGRTPLHEAVICRSQNAAKLLLENRANVEAKTHNFDTPLHLAAICGNVGVTVALLEKSANKEAKDNRDLRPLHRAALHGNAEVAKLLLDSGAEVDVVNNDNWTALHIAAWKGHDKIVSSLLDKGATVDALDSERKTPLYHAIVTSHSNATQLLLKYGANPYALDANKIGLLHLAAETDQKELAHLLIGKGVEVNSASVTGLTPLHVAAREGNLDVAGILLTHGAVVNAATDEGLTPLHYCCLDNSVPVENKSTPPRVASGKGRADIVQLLIDNGADANIKDINGRAPFDLAEDPFSAASLMNKRD